MSILSQVRNGLFIIKQMFTKPLLCARHCTKPSISFVKLTPHIILKSAVIFSTLWVGNWGLGQLPHMLTVTGLEMVEKEGSSIPDPERRARWITRPQLFPLGTQTFPCMPDSCHLFSHSHSSLSAQIREQELFHLLVIITYIFPGNKYSQFYNHPHTYFNRGKYFKNPSNKQEIVNLTLNFHLPIFHHFFNEY